jgi:hypothetical protein
MANTAGKRSLRVVRTAFAYDWVGLIVSNLTRDFQNCAATDNYAEEIASEKPKSRSGGYIPYGRTQS